MSSQHQAEAESHETGETVSELIDEMTNNLKGDLDCGLNSVPDLDSMFNSPSDNEPGSHHLDEKAKTMPTPTSPIEASSNNTNNDLDSVSLDSSVHSNDSNVAVILGSSSESRMSLDSFSAGRRTSPAPEDHVANIAHSISDYEASDNESQSPPAPDTFHADYRKSGSGLMTRHIFTGKFNGKRPLYVPVYKRNYAGNLLKLEKGRSGRWKYVEPEELLEEEIEEGLNILEEPQVEVVLQHPEPAKAEDRRTPAEIGSA